MSGECPGCKCQITFGILDHKTNRFDCDNCHKLCVEARGPRTLHVPFVEHKPYDEDKRMVPRGRMATTPDEEEIELAFTEGVPKQ